MRNRAWMAAGALCAAMALSAAAPLAAQSGGNEIRKTVDSTLAIERETQKKQERWAAERNELVARYKTAKAAIGYLGERAQSSGDRLAEIDKAIADLERSVRESTRLERNLQDTLNAVFVRFDAQVRGDLPFLREEREARLALLRSDLARPGEIGAEKLRRVLEALQVETGYGGTVEVTQEKIVFGGDSLFVDLLRLGRVSLFWRTTDGKKVGEFDRGTGQWIELPGKHSRNIGLAIDMASRMRPINIITLPIGRIQP